MSVIEYAIIEPNSPVILRARFEDESGNVLTVDDTASITAIVTDLSSGESSAPITFDVATSIIALTTSPNWKKDTIGFNCSVRLDGTNFPQPERIYQVVVAVTPTASDPLRKAWHLQTADVV